MHQAIRLGFLVLCSPFFLPYIVNAQELEGDSRLGGQQLPMAASIQRTITKRTEDGAEQVRVESEMFFRDRDGRMRNEVEGMVVLREPGGKAPVMLYPNQRAAIDLSKEPSGSGLSARARWALEEAEKGREARLARAHASLPRKIEPLSQERVSLGSQEISGVLCDGDRFVMVFPAWGMIEESYSITTETWRERGTGRLVRKVRSDTVNNETVVSDYSYMDPDSVLTPELFEVPKDYHLKN